MALRSKFTNSLKGFLLGSLFDFKSIFITSTAIIGGTMIFNYIISALILILSDTQSSNNAGMLTSGYGIAIITFSIGMFVKMSNKYIGQKFVFPINRDIFAIGNFLFVIIGSIIFLISIITFSFIENIFGKIMELLFKGFVFFNEINFSIFGIGMWTSFCYMVFGISCIYFVSMYFHRFKLHTSIIMGLVIATIIAFPFIRIAFLHAFKFIFFEQSVLILSIKLWVLTVIYHILAYIPLKRMEVIK